MMKSEPRPFASLSSGLLARKGAARPAMRPQGFGQMGSGLEDLGWNDMGFEAPRPVLTPVEGEDEAPVHRINPASGLTPISPVHAVQEEIAQRLGNEAEGDAEPVEALAAEPVAAPVAPPAPVSEVARAAPVAAVSAPVPAPRRVERGTSADPAPRPRRSSGAKDKAAFTLRLDTDRHLKLRLACAVTGVSAQQFVTRALDALLASYPELDAMAQRAPERTRSKG